MAATVESQSHEKAHSSSDYSLSAAIKASLAEQEKEQLLSPQEVGKWSEEKKLAAAIQASLAEEEEKKQQQQKTKAKAATKAVSFAHCERIPASAPNDDDSDLAAAIAASLAEGKKRKKKKKIVR